MAACYAAVTGSNQGEGDYVMAKQIDRFMFHFLSETFRLVRICRVTNFVEGLEIEKVTSKREWI